jgi:DMSO/TMAO reductase YedYZ molybdopterin-dependent catalytic subunit
MNRRDLLAGTGAAALAARASLIARPSLAANLPWLSPQLPDGTRTEARFATLPGKRRLIQLADRPPNYEAPIQAFRDAITSSDQFFVRYHLAGVPDMAGLTEWSLTVGGDAAARSVTLTLEDLAAMPQTEVASVCQCSGNRRGLSLPHVAGVQWGYGAMGCATWRGPRLRDVLEKVGMKRDATEVWLDGADGPVMSTTPDFHKSLPVPKAMADETIIATAMNNAPLPLLNGYPARVVVPGWTSTYWMKHVTRIDVSSQPLASFWMQKAYRVPAGMFPVELPFTSQDDQATWPITEIVVNAVIAGPLDGDRVSRAGFTVQGVAWDRGHGIRRVEVSLDDGKTWRDALLGRDLGRFAFRPFSLETGGLSPGPCVISARAISNNGETQAAALKFNPAGYHNNVPQRVTVTIA